MKYHSKAIRLCQRIRNDVATGGVEREGFLLPETRLAEHYGVSRVTLRRSLGLLEKDGLLSRVPNRGVKIIPPDHVLPTAQSERTYTIGIAIQTEPDEGLSLIIEGIHTYLGQTKHRTHLLQTASDECIATRALQQKVDGVIVLPYPGPDQTTSLEALSQNGIKVIAVEPRVHSDVFNSVESDFSNGMYRAVQHLIRTHQRPVYFFGLNSDYKADQDRLYGYAAAMRDAGFENTLDAYVWQADLPPNDPAYWDNTNKWQHGYDLAMKAFESLTFPTSIACVKDYMAWGVYKAAEAKNLIIGEDIHVTGFDDMTISSMLSPTLTTVQQPQSDKGFHAARLLIQDLDNTLDERLHLKLPVYLLPRESSQAHVCS